VQVVFGALIVPPAAPAPGAGRAELDALVDRLMSDYRTALLSLAERHDVEIEVV
jgi:hypothetical protein